jgi:signal transduction histidine kinase
MYSLIACLTLALIILYVLLRNQKLKDRIEDLEANHAKDIQAIQKVIYQQALQDLATDIHDDFGQRLSLIKLMLSGLDPETRPDIGPQIIEIMQLATQTIKDLRTLSHRLRANALSLNSNN